MRRLGQKQPAKARVARATWPARLRALLTVAFVLTTFGFRLGELALVEHAICEHGELVHRHAASRTAAAPRDAATQARTGEETASAGHDGDASPDHEHCDAQALRYDASSVAPSTVQPVELVGYVSWGLAPADAAPPIGVLALAPKTPPPAG